MAHTINYTGNTDSFGNMTYTKKDKQGNVIFENLDDIFCDPDFESLLEGLEE